jgi:excisionase family DNA binding protein
VPMDLIGSKQACNLLSIDRATLSRWVADGRLTYAHKLPGVNGAMLFRRSDIERLAQERAS